MRTVSQVRPHTALAVRTLAKAKSCSTDLRRLSPIRCVRHIVPGYRLRVEHAGSGYSVCRNVGFPGCSRASHAIAGGRVPDRRCWSSQSTKWLVSAIAFFQTQFQLWKVRSRNGCEPSGFDEHHCIYNRRCRCARRTNTPLKPTQQERGNLALEIVWRGKVLLSWRAWVSPLLPSTTRGLEPSRSRFSRRRLLFVWSDWGFAGRFGDSFASR